MKGDTEWTGCPLTRRWTSAPFAQFGQHVCWTSCIAQVPVSLSSGEAETFGLSKAFSRALGASTLVCDAGLGWYLLTCARTVERQSEWRSAVPGNIRHLEAEWLWIQGAITTGTIGNVTNISGQLNQSHILTKGVVREDMERLLRSALVCGLRSCDPQRS